MTGKYKVVTTVINSIPYGPTSLNSITMEQVITTHIFIKTDLKGMESLNSK
jgi:hypothetical protein